MPLTPGAPRGEIYQGRSRNGPEDGNKKERVWHVGVCTRRVVRPADKLPGDILQTGKDCQRIIPEKGKKVRSSFGGLAKGPRRNAIDREWKKAVG